MKSGEKAKKERLEDLRKNDEDEELKIEQNRRTLALLELELLTDPKV